MTDHTAHIEECEREREATWDYLMSMPATSLEAPAARYRHKRAVKAHKDVLVKAYGVPCPVEACNEGHIATGVLDQTMNSPREITSEFCEFCEGRGMVLPAQAKAYQGD